MPTVKLTDAAVRKLTAPAGERVDFFDGALPGLALRVSGKVGQRPERRVWTLFYRSAGKQKRFTLGRYPDLGLAEARQEAGKVQVQVRAGVDPATARETAKMRATTVSAVARDFIRLDLERRNRSQKYVQETSRIFLNHVNPRWGDRDIKTITRRDVIDLLDAVMENGTVIKGPDGKRRKLAGGRIIANRVHSSLRAMFSWSVRRGVIDTSPSYLVEPPADEVKRDRVLTDDELRAIWSAASVLGYPFEGVFKLLMILGQRRNEVARMKWDHLNLDEAIWTQMADSNKSARTHIVPLSPIAVDIIGRLPRIKGQYLFTTTGRSPVSGFARIKERIDELLTCKGTPIADWRIHDLRRSAATGMARLGTSEFIVGKVLNHAAKGITGSVYNRYAYLDEKRAALTQWADHLASITASHKLAG
jgi:integrase